MQPFCGAPWPSLACDILGLLRTVLVAAALLWAGRSHGLPWHLLGTGVAAWVVADVIWLVLAVVGKQPWGSAADIFFLLFYVGTISGILALPRQQPRAGGAWAAELDVAVIVTAAGAAMWVLLVAPSLAGGATAVERAIAIAYPVGDLLLLWRPAICCFAAGCAARARRRHAAPPGADEPVRQRP